MLTDHVGKGERSLNTQFLCQALEASATGEEMDLPSGQFAAYVSKSYPYALSLAAIIGISLGSVLLFLLQDTVAGTAFFSLGVVAALMLPTLFSYRCYVDSDSLKEEYFILFIKRTHQVKWSSIRYRTVRTDASGNPLSIRFYNANKKKVIAFDSSIVGFTRIMRLAKRKGIPKR